MIWTALTLGFLGSFHCVGMCGPIALALPLDRRNFFTRAAGALLYNLGRIFTYAFLGTLFGLIGYSAVLAGYQQSLSVSLGILILVVVLLPSLIPARFKRQSPLYSHIGKVKVALGSLLKKQHPLSLFTIGLLNGLLPCGFVYLAIAGAMAVGTAGDGMVFMAAFGAGTLPALLVVALAGDLIGLRTRSLIRKAVPGFVALMGVVLIFRGLNLDIPFLSPALHVFEHGSANHACH